MNDERYRVEVLFGDGWKEAYLGASFESVERAKVTVSYYENNDFKTRIVDNENGEVKYQTKENEQTY